jgi:hypothetical protein
MLQRFTDLIRAAANWMGGWVRLAALIAVILGLIGWYFWDRGRQLPLPSESRNVTQNLTASARETTFIFNRSTDELRAFYRQALPELQRSDDRDLAR